MRLFQKLNLLDCKVMPDKVIIDNKSVPVSETKVQFGAINSPTPTWAKWVFRSVAILTTVLAFYLSGSAMINEKWKVEILLGLKSLDMLALGFSKLFGIVEDK